MKKILLKTALLLGAVLLVLVPVTLQFQTGYVDAFYTRFTTNRTPSLILGTSRAAQGLLPQEFKLIDPQIQNFAFTLGHSPFGPAYLELIKQKLTEDTSNGIFVVAVDPWAVSLISPKEKEGDLESFRENGRFTTDLHLVNMNPNFEYILRFYPEPLYKALRPSQSLKLHGNGWLEIDIPRDTAKFMATQKSKLAEYQEYSTNGSLSPARLRALEETIGYLDARGDVYLVRLPVGEGMAAIEREYAPEFDQRMQEIAQRHTVHYLNYFNESGKYLTTDGNHLYKTEGKAISKILAADIQRVSQISTAKQ